MHMAIPLVLMSILGALLGAYDIYRFAKGYGAVSRFSVLTLGILLGSLREGSGPLLVVVVVWHVIATLVVQFWVKPIPSRADVFR